MAASIDPSFSLLIKFLVMSSSASNIISGDVFFNNGIIEGNKYGAIE
jgi:hypothetical protein